MNISFTDEAQDYLLGLLKQKGETHIGVRLFVTNPGTPHAETCLAYRKADEEHDNDIIMELKGFTCFIARESKDFLEDASVEYSTDDLGGQLTIKAPNAKMPNITEDSPLDMQVSYFLQTEVNPNLASHGGMVELVEMDDDTAILKFGGGCQGCSSVDFTLKGYVEQTLVSKIPKLKGIRDITDHSDKKNAYYK
jgi:Fe/S biogenesis protein NfuA